MQGVGSEAWGLRRGSLRRAVGVSGEAEDGVRKDASQARKLQKPTAVQAIAR